MKNHVAMYIFLLLAMVLILSRGAAAATSMLAGGSVLTSESQVLSGQYAQKGGNTGSFSFPSPGGMTTTTLG